MRGQVSSNVAIEVFLPFVDTAHVFVNRLVLLRHLLRSFSLSWALSFFVLHASSQVIVAIGCSTLSRHIATLLNLIVIFKILLPIYLRVDPTCALFVE